jgi:hypothetical protein
LRVFSFSLFVGERDTPPAIIILDEIFEFRFVYLVKAKSFVGKGSFQSA